MDVSEIIEQQFPHDPESPENDPSSTDADHRTRSCRSCWRYHRAVHRQRRRCSRGQAVTSSCDPSGSDHRRGADSSRGTGLRGTRRCQSSTRARRHIIALSSRRRWTRQVSRVQPPSDRTRASPSVEVSETRIRSTTEQVCELERERGRIRDHEHRLTESKSATYVAA